MVNLAYGQMNARLATELVVAFFLLAVYRRIEDPFVCNVHMEARAYRLGTRTRSKTHQHGRTIRSAVPCPCVSDTQDSE